jgi:hypothetical protein
VTHVLAVVDDSRRSGEVVAAAQELAAAGDARLTLVAVAVVEDERPGCCDLRSGVWNRMQREVAVEQLQSARAQLAPGLRPRLAVAEGPSVEESLVGESLAADYDVIIIGDERRPLLPWNSRLADRLRARVACEVRTPGGR